MKVFISGGSKSGKSIFSQKIAKKLSIEDHLYYLATMEPHDNEDEARIARHLGERYGWGFKTVEWGRDIDKHLKEIDCKGTYLVDCVTTLFTNEMFGGMTGEPNPAAIEKTKKELLSVSEIAENVIYVSDNIYCDSILFDDFTDSFRKGLAEIDISLASFCDTVIEFYCGNPIYYKGSELL